MATIRKRGGKFQAIVRRGHHSQAKTFSKRADAEHWAKRLEIEIERNGAAQGAFKRLQEHGFIKVIKPGSFIGRRATEYALTDKSLDGHPPTNEWQRWRKKKKQKWDIETIREEAFSERDLLKKR